MESVKKHWIEISLGLAISAISAYAIYRMQSGGKQAVKVDDPFKEVVDQRASQDFKVQQGTEWLREVIAKEINVGGKPLTTINGCLLRREDFTKLQKVMENYAKILLYDVRINH